MCRPGKSGCKGNLGDGKGGLGQQLPALVETALAIERHRALLHLILKKPIELASSHTGKLGQLSEIERVGNVVLHHLDR